jgi:glutamate dehydrogenase (NADP+)
MQDIHDSCYQYGQGKGVNGSCDYLMGANLAGFVKIADAMLAYGVQ